MKLSTHPTNSNSNLRLKSELAELLKKENAVELAVSKLMECLTATYSFWDSSSRQVVTTTDYKTVVRAVEIILEYTEGKPIERRQVTFADISEGGALGKIMQSESGREKIKTMLQQAEKESKVIPAAA